MSRFVHRHRRRVQFVLYRTTHTRYRWLVALSGLTHLSWLQCTISVGNVLNHVLPMLISDIGMWYVACQSRSFPVQSDDHHRVANKLALCNNDPSKLTLPPVPCLSRLRSPARSLSVRSEPSSIRRLSEDFHFRFATACWASCAAGRGAGALVTTGGKRSRSSGVPLPSPSGPS